MDSKFKFNTLIFITVIILFFFVSRANATSTAQVYSISNGKPLVLQDSLKVNTITRGFASNAPVYRAMTQTVGRALFLSVFRKVVGLTPIGVGFIVAYDYFIDEEGNVKSNSIGGGLDYRNASFDGLGRCVFYVGFSHMFNDISFYDCTEKNLQYAGSFPVNLEHTYNSSTGSVIVRGNSFSSYVFEWGGYSSVDFILQPEIVTDDKLFSDLNEYIQNNPGLNHNDIFKNADGSVNQDYFPNPEFSLHSQTDTELMDLYGNGLLQSADPALDNYITPEELARIKAMYDYLHRTDEQKAEDLTAIAKEPMTRAEYAEEQLLKENRAVDSASSLSGIDLGNLDKTEDLDNNFEILDTLMTNTSDLPSVLPTMPQFEFSATCKTVMLPFNVEFPNASQCSKLNILKQMLGYFLYVIFFWMIITQLLKEAN